MAKAFSTGFFFFGAPGSSDTALSMPMLLGSRNFPSEMAKTHLAKALGLAEVGIPLVASTGAVTVVPVPTPSGDGSVV